MIDTDISGLVYVLGTIVALLLLVIAQLVFGLGWILWSHVVVFVLGFVFRRIVE